MFAEGEEDGFGFEAGEADVGGIPEARGVATVDDGAGDLGADLLFKSVAESFEAGSLAGGKMPRPMPANTIKSTV